MSSYGPSGVIVPGGGGYSLKWTIRGAISRFSIEKKKVGKTWYYVQGPLKISAVITQMKLTAVGHNRSAI